MRLSKKNENKRWKKNYQSPSSTRTQTLNNSLKPNFSFPKEARLRKASDYKKVIRQGSKWIGPFLAIDYRQGRSISRLGITVSRKFGKAHIRNRFKRWVREAFRLNQGVFPSNIEFNVTPRVASASYSFLIIQQELLAFKTYLHSKQNGLFQSEF
jgi:ribonuclease P protein component